MIFKKNVLKSKHWRPPRLLQMLKRLHRIKVAIEFLTQGPILMLKTKLLSYDALDIWTRRQYNLGKHNKSLLFWRAGSKDQAMENQKKDTSVGV